MHSQALDLNSHESAFQILTSVFFFGQISPFLTKKLGKFWIFLKVKIQLIFFLFQKKFNIVDIKKEKEKKRSTDPSLL
jgi:hypothetical protein